MQLLPLKLHKKQLLNYSNEQHLRPWPTVSMLRCTSEWVVTFSAYLSLLTATFYICHIFFNGSVAMCRLPSHQTGFTASSERIVNILALLSLHKVTLSRQSFCLFTQTGNREDMFFVKYVLVVFTTTVLHDGGVHWLSREVSADDLWLTLLSLWKHPDGVIWGEGFIGRGQKANKKQPLNTFGGADQWPTDQKLIKLTISALSLG